MVYMIYTGFYIITALFVIHKLSTFTKINLGIIMGLMVPDLDILFKYLVSVPGVHGGPLHSMIFSFFIFISLLIAHELNRHRFNRKIINGLFMGMLIHIFLDILISGQKILFYWPLPMGAVDSLFKFNLGSEIFYILSCIQFLMFRYSGYRLILILTKTKHICKFSAKYINTISKFMRIQLVLFIIFLIMLILKIQFSTTLIDFSMLLSISFALYFLNMIKDIFNKELIIG
mgnify:CR=1 FL=1